MPRNSGKHLNKHPMVDHHLQSTWWHGRPQLAKPAKPCPKQSTSNVCTIPVVYCVACCVLKPPCNGICVFLAIYVQVYYLNGIHRKISSDVPWNMGCHKLHQSMVEGRGTIRLVNLVRSKRVSHDSGILSGFWLCLLNMEDKLTGMDPLQSSRAVDLVSARSAGKNDQTSSTYSAWYRTCWFWS